MKTDLPGPEDVLEELAEKTAAEIDRLAPLGFDRSLQEMANYHRFLLRLSMAQATDGSVVSYAEVAEGPWTVPHTRWTRQYRLLFERAANRLPDDDHFISSLAYVPHKLFSGSDDADLPHSVKSAILRLGPILMHCLQNWITKRTVVDTLQDEAAAPRLALAGSDAKAYANALPEIVGAWENLLWYGPLTRGLRGLSEKTEAERWASYRVSWPQIWDHLIYTAYGLAIVVWNEDEAGAAIYRESLVGWLEKMNHRFRSAAQLRHRRMLYPSLLQLDWEEARTSVAALSYGYLPAPSPDQLFSSIVRGAHDDVVLLTAVLFLFWNMTNKQASDIGGRTARSLLSREGADHLGNGTTSKIPAFHSLFLDFVRLRTAGERFGDGTYAAQLDGLVELLDNMTERRVVPGRIYSPSTLQGRHDLLLPIVSILVAATPSAGDDGLVERVTVLSREEEVLPDGDESLRRVLREFESWRSVLENPVPAFAQGVRFQDPERDPDHAATKLMTIITAAEAGIEAERLQRLNALPIDSSRLEYLRSSIQKTLLEKPIEVPFYFTGRATCVQKEENLDTQHIRFNGISKGQLTDPPMESPALNLDRVLISGTREWIQQQAWRALCQRKPLVKTLDAQVRDERFWRDVALYSEEVYPEPVLVISQSSEEQSLRSLLRAPPSDLTDLKIEKVPQERDALSYMATINGVHVYGADLPPGQAWLLSSRTIRNIYYVKFENTGQYVEIVYVEGEGKLGTLRVSVKLQFEWSEGPTFQFHMGSS